LGFFPGVDLDKTGQPSAAGCKLPGERRRQAGPVKAFDHIENRHRLADLVALQRADQMQFDIGKFRLEGGPFGSRFLHPVFAENTLSGLDDRSDMVTVMGFGDRHKRHAARRASGHFFGFLDLGFDSRQIALQLCTFQVTGQVMTFSDFATLAKYARRLNQMSGAAPLPALIFITDQARLPDPLAVIAKLHADCAVIFRDYDAPDRPNLGQKLAQACRDRSVSFLVAGDGALAEVLGADGLHMPEGRIDEIGLWRERHPDWLITAAAHAAKALDAAHKAGADAALLSPVFPTKSHPETLSGDKAPLGAENFARLSDKSPLAVYALGGITAENAALIKGKHTAGLAAISAFAD
jgi:thiamine-phosphate pyrophosphorylase